MLEVNISNQDSSIRKRKEEHLRISLNESVDFPNLTTGFDQYYFIHQALPEINLNEVDLSTSIFGKDLKAPIIISSMVGGINAAVPINRNLALAAQNLGLAMGVGSQRCLIDSPEMLPSYQIRDVAPDILLFANLGAVQLNYGYGISECLNVVQKIGADALILHLNPLQEALQPEGNTRFSGLLHKIEEICRNLPVPVIVKEVGGGISEEVAEKLVDIGISGIDVAGAGGTCWSEIERRREHNEMANKVGQYFSSWGIPTSETIIMTRKAAPHLPVIASGGIRTGIDAVKAIALGADAIGIAGPLLKAASASAKEVEEYLILVREVMRIAMFCIGAANINKCKYSRCLKKR